MIATQLWVTSRVHHTPNDHVENVNFQQVADISNLLWRWIQLQFSA